MKFLTFTLSPSGSVYPHIANHEKGKGMRTLSIVVAAATAIACGQALAHASLAEVTVYDRSAGRWLPVYRHQGRMYVAGKPGQRMKNGTRIPPS